MATHFSGPVLNRDKAGTGSSRAWFSNLPIGESDPDLVKLMRDFTLPTDYSTSDWTLTLTGTGTAAVNTTSGEGNGVLALVTTGASGDSNELQAKTDAWTLTDGKRLWFECSVSSSDVAAVDLMVGLSEQTTTPLTSQNYVAIRMPTGAAALVGECVNGGTKSSINFPTDDSELAASTLAQLGFYYDGEGGVHFYFNRNEVGHITSNLPTAALAPLVFIQTNSANARTADVDYIYVAKER